MKSQKFSIRDILAKEPTKKYRDHVQEANSFVIDSNDRHIPSLPTPPCSPEAQSETMSVQEYKVQETPKRANPSAPPPKRKRERDPIGQILDSLCGNSDNKSVTEPSAFSPIITSGCSSQLSPLSLLAQCDRRCYQSSPNVPTCTNQLPASNSGVISPTQVSVEQLRYLQAQRLAQQQYLQQQQQQMAVYNGSHPFVMQQTNPHHVQMLREHQAKIMAAELAGAALLHKRACDTQNHPASPMWMTWFKTSPGTMTSLPLRESRIPPPPRYQCDACKKSYSTFGGLSKHKQFHCISHVKKEFNCKYCDKSYGSLGALKMHIRTHTLPCKCKLCGKAFSRPWLLQGHLRTHTGEKPFKCVHCGRAFADRSNLRAHLQTHSDIKKYGCKNCTKTFSRMSLLLKHEEGSCLGLRR